MRIRRPLCWLLLLCCGYLAHAAPAIPEDAQLSRELTPLIARHSGKVAVAILNLETDEHFAVNQDVPMPTASLIKLPLMIAVYRAVDDDQLSLDTPLELREGDKVPGSGILTEHFSNGVALPVRDYVRLMMRYSDNTATNIVVDQVGLNKTADTMENLGFPNTKLHSKVYRGDSTIFPARSQQFGIGSATAGEMVELLVQLQERKLAGSKSTEAMLDHLMACEDRSKLARHLPAELKIAHKTGAIANSRTDAGLIYTQAGPVAVCVLTTDNEDQRWTEDNAADTLCAEIGRVIANRFGSPAVSNTLREGSVGKLVEALQRTLNLRMEPSPKLAIDGDFGPATHAAVVRFQRAHQLEETGIVSAATWQALGTLIDQEEPVPDPSVVNSEPLRKTVAPDLDGPPIVTCKAWAIGDRQTGERLFGEHADLPLEMASTTKIMSAYLVIQLSGEDSSVLDEVVTFSSRADSTVGSTSGIRAGERVAVRELLYGLLLPSGNDAAIALAEHFGERLSRADGDGVEGDPLAAFVAAMNRTARELGMLTTHFVNPHGLSDPAHVTSAADLLRLAHGAMQSGLFRRIVGTRQYGCTVESDLGYRRNVKWVNTNELLGVEGYAGIKTGTTSAAGACLVSAGRRGQEELLLVVLGSSSSPSRFADSRNLFRWAWRQRR